LRKINACKGGLVAASAAVRRKMTFADRAEAGRLLAERVVALRLAAPLVLALPRGGVPVAAEVARALEAPLDVALVRKIGAPYQPELAVGAVADGVEPEVVLNEELVAALGIDPEFIAARASRELATIEQRRSDYAPLRARVDPEGRAVIVVDDGVATGMTMQAALRHLKRRKPARLIAAVPVASREAVEMLQREADEVVCLAAPRDFGSVGGFYRDFGQVSDEEVAALLRAANA
jgi:putative phosphoribosyl transferase